MVESTPSIFLLNPLTRARIDLPSLSTFPSFPTEVVFMNSRNLNQSFIMRERIHIRDTFVAKAIVSDDPSIATNSLVVVIFGFNENLAFCRSKDTDWTIVESSLPRRYKDILFQEEKLYAVDQMGRVSIFIFNEENSMISVATVKQPSLISSRSGYRQWYLASSDEEMLLIGRYRKIVPNYEYKTERFEVFKMEESEWRNKESLGDKVLFVGTNSSIYISGRNCKKNCIYFTDDYMRSCKDFVWEGHDFGIFDFEDRKFLSLGGLVSWPIKQPSFPKIFYFEHTLFRDTSLFVLPPPVWVTISP